MGCSVPSHHGIFKNTRKNLNCKVLQYMKLNAGLLTNSNSKTVLMTFMCRRNAQKQDSLSTLKS